MFSSFTPPFSSLSNSNPIITTPSLSSTTKRETLDEMMQEFERAQKRYAQGGDGQNADLTDDHTVQSNLHSIELNFRNILSKLNDTRSVIVDANENIAYYKERINLIDDLLTMEDQLLNKKKRLFEQCRTEYGFENEQFTTNDVLNLKRSLEGKITKLECEIATFLTIRNKYNTVIQSVMKDEQIDSVEDNNKCDICCVNDKNYACVPCGHVYCKSCIDKANTCPMCRKIITSKLKLHLSNTDDSLNINPPNPTNEIAPYESSDTPPWSNPNLDGEYDTITVSAIMSQFGALFNNSQSQLHSPSLYPSSFD